MVVATSDVFTATEANNDSAGFNTRRSRGEWRWEHGLDIDVLARVRFSVQGKIRTINGAGTVSITSTIIPLPSLPVLRGSGMDPAYRANEPFRLDSDLP